jgi:hypothetical protein
METLPNPRPRTARTPAAPPPALWSDWETDPALDIFDALPAGAVRTTPRSILLDPAVLPLDGDLATTLLRRDLGRMVDHARATRECASNDLAGGMASADERAPRCAVERLPVTALGEAAPILEGVRIFESSNRRTIARMAEEIRAGSADREAAPTPRGRSPDR